MAARKWTLQQRTEQSIKIQEWQPWQHSTGAKSAAGKAKVSKNAYTSSFRQRQRFLGQWLLHKRYCTADLTPELIAVIAMRSNQLGIELSTSTQHSRFFADMAISNVTVAMAIDCNNQLGFYQRQRVINSAAETVLGKR